MEEATEKEFTSDGFFKTGDNAQMGGSSEELQMLQDGSQRGSYWLCSISCKQNILFLSDLIYFCYITTVIKLYKLTNILSSF